MTRWVALGLTLTMGCGTLLNSGTATIRVPRGATVDGIPGPAVVSKKRSHEIEYPDGRRCIVESNVSGGYVLADIVFWFLLGVLIDAATENWKTLDGDACPGVVID